MTMQFQRIDSIRDLAPQYHGTSVRFNILGVKVKDCKMRRLPVSTDCRPTRFRLGVALGRPSAMSAPRDR